MKSVSIMRVQHNLSEVLRSLGPGERVAITRNKKVVAELVAPLDQARPEFPDFGSRARLTWNNPWQGRSTSELVNETRGER
jgi:antitoxin (DNA-binding transcriptional repressor) of toxin-antitoxin stability system